MHELQYLMLCGMVLNRKRALRCCGLLEYDRLGLRQI